MSRPSEPVETVSMSIVLSFLPSFMMEPLPKARSIWVSAASRAFDLSMDEPSTRRRAGWLIIALHMGHDSPRRQTSDQKSDQNRAETDGSNVPYLFSVRNMFFLGCGLCRCCASIGSPT